MPFSSLTDPVEFARASAALDAAWERVQQALPAGSNADVARARLADIVASLITASLDERDLADRAVTTFMKRSVPAEGAMCGRKAAY